MVGLSKKRVFPKTKGDSITGQDRAQKHCDFRFSQIEKNLKSQLLQLEEGVLVFISWENLPNMQRVKGKIIRSIKKKHPINLTIASDPCFSSDVGNLISFTTIPVILVGAMLNSWQTEQPRLTLIVNLFWPSYTVSLPNLNHRCWFSHRRRWLI